jgi:hypothetical protein
MLAENIRVVLGVGMSIGSVPPNPGHNCIRNVTFRNVHFFRPFKGIYVKTNPGSNGDGEITDVRYQNITMHKPIWWAIYIGPQQMREPSGDGPGCLLYPYDPKHTCETQPRISISRLSLSDVTIHESLLPPIIFRCNESNPCHFINFTNVVADKWRVGHRSRGVVCENVQGVQANVHPSLYCLESGPAQAEDLAAL